MKIVTAVQLSELVAAAGVRDRRRLNLNLHSTLEDPIQRLGAGGGNGGMRPDGDVVRGRGHRRAATGGHAGATMTRRTTGRHLWPPLLAAGLSLAWLLVQATGASLAAVIVAALALAATGAAAPDLGRTRVLAIAVATLVVAGGVAVVVVSRLDGPAAAAWMIGWPVLAAPIAPILYALTLRGHSGEHHQ